MDSYSSKPQPLPHSDMWRWISLGILIVVALFSIIDRQIFILLAEPVKVDLGLTDIQLGLLQGFGFSAFAAAISLPIGWLVDKYDRRIVLAGCIAVWSLAVFMCGFAQNFEVLFIASMCVGAGEAGVIPVSYALIPVLFDGARRQYANSLYTLTGRLGLGAALAFCGALIFGVHSVAPYLPAPFSGMAEWRLSFLAASMLGPLMILIVFAIPRDFALPATRALPASGEEKEAADTALLPFMRLHLRSYLTFYGAMFFAMFGLTALTTWLPVVAIRKYALSAAAAGGQFGAVTLIASVIGVIGTSILIRAAGARAPQNLAIRVLAVASGGAALVAALLPFTTTNYGLLGVYTLHLSVAMLGTMVYPTALQTMAPDRLRGRAVALIGMVQFVAMALAPPAVGWTSSILDPSGNELLSAILIIAVPTIAICSLLFFTCLKSFGATVADAERFG